MNQVDIQSMSIEELTAALSGFITQPFRVSQIHKWLRKGVEDFDEMLNLPKSIRNELRDHFFLAYARIIKVSESKADGTIKFLNQLYDGSTVESVLMRYKHGYSICISTQVGCKMGCSFCATGQDGFFRNLRASEMESQIQAARRHIGQRISNVVLMGMGEPLDNEKEVLRFFTLLTREEGLNIGMRHVSLSTCGLADKIYALAKLNLQLTLSVSLHAPTDELRNQIMPVNRRWSLDALMKACKDYAHRTKRRISFEYAMIGGFNDSLECAQTLASRLRGILSHVNLIPINPVNGSQIERTSPTKLKAFQQALIKSGYSCTIRRTLGADIDASCGQLKRRYSMEKKLNQ